MRSQNTLTFLAFGLLSALFLNDAFSGGAYLLRDILTFFHPWQTLVKSAIHAGYLPMWNPHTYCGVPLLANLQSGFFYPINWLYWFLPFDTALTLGMALHLALAGFLLRGFLRRIGLSEWGAFFGGALFAFSAWSIAYLEFPMKIGSIVWIPLIWSGLWDAMHNAHRRGLARAAVGVALSLLAGYPQLALFGFLSATLLALLLGIQIARAGKTLGKSRVHRIGAWPVALLLGGLVAAAQLLPAAEMAGLSAKTAAYDSSVALSRSLPWRGLLGLLDPFFFGLPGLDRFWGGEIGEYCFGAFYFGLFPLALAGAAAPVFRRWKQLRRMRREDVEGIFTAPVAPRVVPFFLLGGIILGALLALGSHTPLYPLLQQYVPGFGRSRWPATAGVLIALHGAPLAAIGLEWVLRRKERVRRVAMVSVLLGIALAAFWFVARGPGAAWIDAFQTAGKPAFQIAAHEAHRGTWLATLLPRAAGLFAIGIAGLLLRGIHHHTAAAWTVIVLLDLFFATRALDMPTARGFYDRIPDNAPALVESLAGKRVYTPRTTDQIGNALYGSRNPHAFDWAQRHLLCNANVPSGVSQALGCEPLNPRRHAAFAQAFDAPNTAHALRERIFDLWDAGALLTSKISPDDVVRLETAGPLPNLSRHEPQLGRASVVSGWQNFDDGNALLSALFARPHDPARLVLLENEPDSEAALPAASPAGAKCKPVHCDYDFNAMEMSWTAGDAGMLRVLESWAPGWQATVNGAKVPVYRADFLFMAIAVPAGDCEVRFEYRPPSVVRGLALSALGVVLVFFTMLRRRIRPAAAAATALLLIAPLLPGCAKPSAFTARNVVLISVDTLRADRLGCYGCPNARTPFWDRMARRGSQFRSAISPAPFTVPSHATIMTGLTPPEHRARYNSMRTFAPPSPPLAEALGAAGWKTAAFTGTIVLDSETGLQRGFDTWEYRDHDGQLDRRADAVVRSASRWVRQLDDDSPFFLFVHCYDAHEPYEPPDPWSLLPDCDAYQGEIAFADRELAGFLRGLESEGRLDKTLVVATSDHGEEFGEHGVLHHGFYVYENTLNVPLVMWGPHPFRSGSLRTDPARLLDLYPTILEAVRLAFVQNLEGRPLQERLDPWKTVESYAETWWAALEFDAADLRSFRDGDWKYIRAPREELYNLEDDPGEQNNLIDVESERAADLRERMFEFLGDDLLHPAGFAEAEAPTVERREDLAALGYVGGSTIASGRDFADLADPKDMAGFPALVDQLSELAQAGRWAEVVPVADRLLALHPTNTNALRTKTRALIATGTLEEGLTVYEQALASAPDKAALWNDFGGVLLGNGRAEEARKAFRKSIALDDSAIEARFNFALAALQTGRPRIALKELEALLERKPEHARARQMMEEVSQGLKGQ